MFINSQFSDKKMQLVSKDSLPYDLQILVKTTTKYHSITYSGGDFFKMVVYSVVKVKEHKWLHSIFMRRENGNIIGNLHGNSCKNLFYLFLNFKLRALF